MRHGLCGRIGAVSGNIGRSLLPPSFSASWGLVKHADELDRQWPGEGNSFRYFFKDKADLTLDDADAPNAVALACNAEVATLNERMSAIASAFRLTFVRDRDLSVTPPAPPPELTEIRHSRDAIVLRYRDALAARLSGTGVAHLQAYIRSRGTFIGGPVPATLALGQTSQSLLDDLKSFDWVQRQAAAKTNRAEATAVARRDCGTRRSAGARGCSGQ
jgi:hypothetical protein